MTMKTSSLLRVGVAAVLALSGGAASAAYTDSFENGLLGWTTGGDVAAQILGGNGIVSLTTASATFNDDQGLLLNLSGQDPLAAGQPGGLENLVGVSLGGLDVDPVLQQAYEGSALVRQFSVGAGERLSFSWLLSTRDTPATGLGLDYAFVVINGQRFNLAGAGNATLPGGGLYTASTGWQSFNYVFNQAGMANVAFGVADVGDFDNTTQLSLDNVSIAAVPEPENYALFLAGLGLIGVVARRRRR